MTRCCSLPTPVLMTSSNFPAPPLLIIKKQVAGLHRWRALCCTQAGPQRVRIPTCKMGQGWLHLCAWEYLQFALPVYTVSTHASRASEDTASRLAVKALFPHLLRPISLLSHLVKLLTCASDHGHWAGWNAKKTPLLTSGARAQKAACAEVGALAPLKTSSATHCQNACQQPH